MFILINGLQVNALTFGKEVILAGSASDTVPINQNLQKFFAIVIITLICQLQAYSRSIYIRISNALALFKVCVLTFIVLCGFVVLGGTRRPSDAPIETPYGIANFSDDFALQTRNLSEYSLALLNVMRAFLGYENANFVSFLVLLYDSHC